MVTPFIKYDSRNFSGCADSFAGQGICSLCGEHPAEFARSRKAYCLNCCFDQLTKTQRKLYKEALNEDDDIISSTLCIGSKKRYGVRDFKALEGLVELGLMEEILREHTKQKELRCVTVFFKVKINPNIL